MGVVQRSSPVVLVTVIATMIHNVHKDWFAVMTTAPGVTEMIAVKYLSHIKVSTGVQVLYYTIQGRDEPCSSWGVCTSLRSNLSPGIILERKNV